MAKKRTEATLTASVGDLVQTWERGALEAALRLAGFRHQPGVADLVEAVALRDACERHLDKETDDGLVRLYEIADLATGACARATLRVSA